MERQEGGRGEMKEKAEKREGRLEREGGRKEEEGESGEGR